MKVLIDTHVLIWWTAATRRIPSPIRDILLDPATEVLVSAASAWEIATKLRQKRLEFDPAFMADFEAGVAALAFLPLPVTASHAVAGASIEATHRDPFDRVLAGQALIEGASVITADPAFAGLGVPVLW